MLTCEKVAEKGSSELTLDARLGRQDKAGFPAEALGRLALHAVQTTAQRGDVALGSLRHVDAARRLRDAHDDVRTPYRFAQPNPS
jgi:hypothetical protein